MIISQEDKPSNNIKQDWNQIPNTLKIVISKNKVILLQYLPTWDLNDSYYFFGFKNNFSFTNKIIIKSTKKNIINI